MLRKCLRLAAAFLCLGTASPIAIGVIGQFFIQAAQDKGYYADAGQRLDAAMSALRSGRPIQRSGPRSDANWTPWRRSSASGRRPTSSAWLRNSRPGSRRRRRSCGPSCRAGPAYRSADDATRAILDEGRVDQATIVALQRALSDMAKRLPG